MLASHDLDAALEHGLLDAQPCPACDPACSARLLEARDARRFALAARERHRARAARLVRRKAGRETTRASTAAPAADATIASRPALPGAATDVLARALAKAAGRATR
ncbi:MAG: hypothetical protein EOP93_09215 [Lysobacteraceae bacterium]|nr:MAG: hypothetical protein EOP93_09215 [Xanthomonadaceae bacterium]